MCYYQQSHELTISNEYSINRKMFFVKSWEKEEITSLSQKKSVTELLKLIIGMLPHSWGRGLRFAESSKHHLSWLRRKIKLRANQISAFLKSSHLLNLRAASPEFSWKSHVNSLTTEIFLKNILNDFKGWALHRVYSVTDGKGSNCSVILCVNGGQLFEDFKNWFFPVKKKNVWQNVFKV